MLVSVGTKLGPYEILAPIGAGGMGEVYKARDTRLDRIVAVKVSKTEFSERFEREARLIATPGLLLKLLFAAEHPGTSPEWRMGRCRYLVPSERLLR